MARQIEKYVVYNMRKTYHELGEYEFKIVLNPKFFKTSHESEVKIIDSDLKSMKFIVKRWGRKINCSFIIDKDVADGVSQVNVILKSENGNETNALLRFWVIK